MEFNSHYVKETKLNDENKFLLDFANEEETKSVVFSLEKDYFITSLNANIKLDENKKVLENAVKTSDAWDNIFLKLSKISNDLATKGATYQNDIKTVLFEIRQFGLEFQTENLDLILDNNIIDMSFKYRYYDVDEYKFKEGKIYNPYKHFREIGMSFKTSRNGYEKILKAKLNLENNKIIYTLDFDRKLFDFDSFYISKNQFFILDPLTHFITTL